MEAIQNQAADDRLIGVQGVPGAAIICVTRLIRVEDVVRRIFEPAETEGRTLVIAFGRMVEYHIEDDLDAGAMQRLDHIPKLVQGPEGVLAGTVRVVGGEERHRTVAPVVDEAWRTVLSVKLEDWEQLYSGDTEILQIGNLGDDAGIGAPRGQGQAGTRVPREPADVHFVNHRVCKGALQRSVPFPVVLTGVCHNALHGGGGSCLLAGTLP